MKLTFLSGNKFGFTIIEIIISLLIISSLIAVFLFRDLFYISLSGNQIKFTNQLLKDLQLTQALAINLDQPYHLSINASNYDIKDVNNVPYIHDVLSAADFNFPTNLSINISPTFYNPIYFFSSGEPAFFNTTSNQLEPINQPILISIVSDNFPKQVEIIPETGAINEL